jgi:hypothetical protein
MRTVAPPDQARVASLLAREEGRLARECAQPRDPANAIPQHGAYVAGHDAADVDRHTGVFEEAGAELFD